MNHVPDPPESYYGNPADPPQEGRWCSKHECWDEGCCDDPSEPFDFAERQTGDYNYPK